jgi:Uma2 family endonuclease
MELTIDYELPGGSTFIFPENMSEEAFSEFCMQNPELNLERDARGNILVMKPVNMLGGRFEIRATTALDNWNDQHRLGMAFSYNTGFTLTNGAVRSPDASWISNKRLATLPKIR